MEKTENGKSNNLKRWCISAAVLVLVVAVVYGGGMVPSSFRPSA